MAALVSAAPMTGPRVECAAPHVEADSSAAAPAVTAAARRVAFSHCTVFHFAVALDRCKLPSDGVAPLGLGALISSEMLAIDAYESERFGRRRHAAALHVESEARVRRLVGAVSVEEFEAVARENRQCLEGAEPPMRAPSHAERGVSLPTYTTARPGDERTGVGGGFRERDESADGARRERAAEEQRRKQQRLSERTRCSGCRRFACIC
jgi:hypothetical protein